MRQIRCSTPRRPIDSTRISTTAGRGPSPTRNGFSLLHETTCVSPRPIFTPAAFMGSPVIRRALPRLLAIDHTDLMVRRVRGERQVILPERPELAVEIEE